MLPAVKLLLRRLAVKHHGQEHGTVGADAGAEAVARAPRSEICEEARAQEEGVAKVAIGQRPAEFRLRAEVGVVVQVGEVVVARRPGRRTDDVRPAGELGDAGTQLGVFVDGRWDARQLDLGA